MNDFDQRRKWFEHYAEQISQGAIKSPRLGVRYTCPCCGYPTLEERCRWDICELCSWEDDGQDAPHAAEIWGGPNIDYSLSQARDNFNRYLIMYDPAKPNARIGGASNTSVQEHAKLAIVEAFGNMVGQTDQEKVDDLWEQVYVNEKVIENELYRKVREYEAQMKD